jgi:large subunit ribosomal protein L28
MAKCNVCGKGPQFGHNRSHALNATRKISQPNLFKKSLVIKGETKRINVCARCIRTMQKQGTYMVAVK